MDTVATKELTTEASTRSLDVKRIQQDFPILHRQVHGRRLVYLDNAATTQKPDAVIEAIGTYYRSTNANIHRGLHTLSEEATEQYEGVRKTVARFIGAADPNTIIFTRNATESLNVIAYAWGNANLREGDEILLSVMEHHSNLVPWYIIAKQTGAVVRHIPITDDGRLDLRTIGELINKKTKVVSLMHISNVLGTINPVADIAEMAQKVGALMVVDAAQSAPHANVDVNELGADFVALSAHKMLGPTGVGVLWGRKNLLEEMDPFLGGGDMISSVSLEGAEWNDLPWKFEAGTPNIADVIGFGPAVEYLENLGMDRVREHEIELTAYALDQLRGVGTIDIYGPENPEDRAGVISFNLQGIHPHDVGTIMDSHGIAIRAGHHCAQPLMDRLGQPATARASFYVYNDRDDVDALVAGLRDVRRFFGDG